MPDTSEKYSMYRNTVMAWAYLRANLQTPIAANFPSLQKCRAHTHTHIGDTIYTTLRKQAGCVGENSVGKCNNELRTQLLLLSYTRSENSANISRAFRVEMKTPTWCQSICGKLSGQTSSRKRIRFNGFSRFRFCPLEFNKFYYINGEIGKNFYFSNENERKVGKKKRWQTF